MDDRELAGRLQKIEDNTKNIIELLEASEPEEESDEEEQTQQEIKKHFKRKE